MVEPAFLKNSPEKSRSILFKILFSKGKSHPIVELLTTDLDIWGHSRLVKILSCSLILWCYGYCCLLVPGMRKTGCFLCKVLQTKMVGFLLRMWLSYDSRDSLFLAY